MFGERHSDTVYNYTTPNRLCLNLYPPLEVMAHQIHENEDCHFMKSIYYQVISQVQVRAFSVIVVRSTMAEHLFWKRSSY